MNENKVKALIVDAKRSLKKSENWIFILKRAQTIIGVKQFSTNAIENIASAMYNLFLAELEINNKHDKF